MKIKVIVGHYYFRILINGLPHLVLETRQFMGFHSWKDSDSLCCIEFITKTNKVRVEYDNEDKWKRILKALNDNL